MSRSHAPEPSERSAFGLRFRLITPISQSALHLRALSPRLVNLHASAHLLITDKELTAVASPQPRRASASCAC